MPKKKQPVTAYVGPVSLASVDRLRRIATTKCGEAFVWPNEGEFSDSGWKFNDTCQDFQPLWVDPTNANLLVKVHDRLEKTENQQKFQSMIADDRGTFGFLVEESWKLVAR